MISLFLKLEILYNLMDHAVRYGRSKGHVWVRLSGK